MAQNEKSFEILDGPGYGDLLLIGLRDGNSVRFTLKDGPFTIKVEVFIESVGREVGEDKEGIPCNLWRVKGMWHVRSIDIASVGKKSGGSYSSFIADYNSSLRTGTATLL